MIFKELLGMVSILAANGIILEHERSLGNLRELQSFSGGQTPANLHRLEEQKKKVEYLRGTISPSLEDEAMKKMVKSAEMTIQNSLLLQQQTHQLESENQLRRKRKGRTKQAIQNGGSLTVAKVKKREEEQRPPRPRRPQKCSNCGILGHNRHQCTSKQPHSNLHRNRSQFHSDNRGSSW